MGTCGDCKHFKDYRCGWWLCPVARDASYPACFLPKTIQDYPKIPQTSPYPVEDGRCRYCGGELKGRQTSYCSKAHATTYTSRFNWREVRIRVWNRDNGRCVICGENAPLTEAEIDHVQAVMNGGSYWDYENLRTLCQQCHKRKTRQDFFLLKRKDVGTATLDLFLQGGKR